MLKTIALGPFLTAIFMVNISLVVNVDECYTNGDCFSDFRHLRIVCCKNSRDSDRICQPYNCQGRYCFTDGDCGGEGECCINKRCIHSQNCLRCNKSSDCAASEYCCKRAQGNVCRRNCLRERCEKGGHQCAGPGEYCDSENVCKKLMTPIHTPKQITKQTQTSKQTPTPKRVPTTDYQTQTPKKKSEPCTCSRPDPFPGWAIGFVVIGLLLAIIFAIVSYLLRQHCKSWYREGRAEVVNQHGELLQPSQHHVLPLDDFPN